MPNQQLYFDPQQLYFNPFKIGDKNVYVKMGTEIITNKNTSIILDSGKYVHVAGSSQPFSYEQETIDGHTETVNIPGEIVFFIYNYEILDEEQGLKGLDGEFYRAKVDKGLLQAHNLVTSNIKEIVSSQYRNPLS